MRRRILATVLAALMALSLTACGGNNVATDNTGTDNTAGNTTANDTAGGDTGAAASSGVEDGVFTVGM